MSQKSFNVPIVKSLESSTMQVKSEKQEHSFHHDLILILYKHAKPKEKLP